MVMRQLEVGREEQNGDRFLQRWLVLRSPGSDAQHKNVSAVCGLCLAGGRDRDVCHWVVAECGPWWSRGATRWPLANGELATSAWKLGLAALASG